MKSRFMPKVPALFLSLLLLLTASQASLAAPEVAPAPVKEGASYLFVQSAEKMQLKAHPESPNTYIITLKNVNPYLTCFSDRPARKTKTLSTEKFIEFWHNKNADSFLKIPPNASLVATQTNLLSKDSTVNWVVELSKPKYDSKTKTLQYTAKLLTDHVGPAAEAVTFEHAFLFIDDVCLCCFMGTC